jgi:hypothetical protein
MQDRTSADSTFVRRHPHRGYGGMFGPAQTMRRPMAAGGMERNPRVNEFGSAQGSRRISRSRFGGTYQ